MSEECAHRASELDTNILTSWILRSNIITTSILTMITCVTTIIAVRDIKRYPIFNETTRVLLYMALLFAVVHDFAHFSADIWVITKSFFYADDLCNLMFYIPDCIPIGRFLLFGIMGMIYIHSALSIDVLLLTIIPNSYHNLQRLPAIILGTLAIVTTIIVQLIVLPIDDYNEYMHSCLYFPKKVEYKANIFLLSSLGILIINFIINIITFMYNREKDKRCIFNEMTTYTDRKSYDVNQRYQLIEAQMTTKAVSLLLSSQIISLTMYSGATALFRLYRDVIPSHLYPNLIKWFYGISYASCSLPLLIIFVIKHVRRNRRRLIDLDKKRKDTQQFRMDELKLMWG